jgi:hypothetical protein
VLSLLDRTTVGNPLLFSLQEEGTCTEDSYKRKASLCSGAKVYRIKNAVHNDEMVLLGDPKPRPNVQCGLVKAFARHSQGGSGESHTE